MNGILTGLILGFSYIFMTILAFCILALAYEFWYIALLLVVIVFFKFKGVSFLAIFGGLIGVAILLFGVMFFAFLVQRYPVFSLCLFALFALFLLFKSHDRTDIFTILLFGAWFLAFYFISDLLLALFVCCVIALIFSMFYNDKVLNRDF
ncbi:hypothetical protein KDD93_08755 [Campylobacter sp. faydin G-24]|uniref:Uncharacterized protein n=1 Tax=Campylobacter anatolicus TaxID=2829105 RepID=A0ABS5HLP1_9BACT|nr:hypothetical protein [Campylobacter anatolicus]MBR8464647.1 hypothetical protein [Campylobacter anatolicus]